MCSFWPGGYGPYTSLAAAFAVSLQGWRVPESLARPKICLAACKDAARKDEPGYIFELAVCKTLAKASFCGACCPRVLRLKWLRY